MEPDLFASGCARCHGPNGNRIPVVPLDSREYLSAMGDPNLVATVTKGKKTMPAFSREEGGNMTVEQIEAVVRYLWAPNGPAGKDALPSGADGHLLYLDKCSSCHGLDGAKLSQARIGSDEYVNSRGESALVRVIGTGQGKMPAFAGSLQAGEIKSVIAYLRTVDGGATAQAAQVPAPGNSLSVPHEVDGRTSVCLTCHGASGLVPAPADHAGRSNRGCLACHKAPVRTGGAPGIPLVPHELQGKDQCLVCHGENGMLPAPAGHAGRPRETCLQCHRPMAQAAGQLLRTPHELEGRENCLGCHKAGFLQTMPADHAGRPQDKCKDCHKPAQAAPSKATPQIRHDIARAQDCLKCHGPKPNRG